MDGEGGSSFLSSCVTLPSSESRLHTNDHESNKNIPLDVHERIKFSNVVDISWQDKSKRVFMSVSRSDEDVSIDCLFVDPSFDRHHEWFWYDV